MNAKARLATGGALMLAGSAMAAIAARSTWFTVARADRFSFVEGFGRTRFRTADIAVSGGEVAGEVVGLTLLMLVAAALAYLFGQWRRLALHALVAIAGIAAILIAASVHPGDAIGVAFEHGVAPAVTVERHASVILAQIGAGLAAATALVSARDAARTRRVRLPESAPSDDLEQS